MLAIRGVNNTTHTEFDWIDETSFDWGTEEELEGVCAYKVDYHTDKEEQIEAILRAKEEMERIYGYERYYLIGSTSDKIQYGCDDNEVIFNDAYVLAKI